MFLSIAALAVALSSPAPAEISRPAEAEIRQIELNIVHYTNLERQRFGLRPLKLDPALLRSARHQASWMASRRSLTHTSQAVAENIAMGQRSSVETVRNWMSSPGHRANMLNGGYTKVGAAAYTSAEGTIYWCLQLVR